VYFNPTQIKSFKINADFVEIQDLCVGTNRQQPTTHTTSLESSSHAVTSLRPQSGIILRFSSNTSCCWQLNHTKEGENPALAEFLCNSLTNTVPVVSSSC